MTRTYTATAPRGDGRTLTHVLTVHPDGTATWNGGPVGRAVVAETLFAWRGLVRRTRRYGARVSLTRTVTA